MAAKTPQSNRNADRNPKVAAANQAFGALLKSYMDAGFRPPGQHRQRWTVRELASRLPGREEDGTASQRAVEYWRAGQFLTDEEAFLSILRAMFGPDPRVGNQKDREELKAAYKEAYEAKHSAACAASVEPEALAVVPNAIPTQPASQPAVSEIWRADQSLYPAPDDSSPVRFFVHDGTPEAPNTLNVSLMYGAVSGRLPAAGTLPELRFQLHIQRVQIQPDWRDVQWEKGSINPSGPVTYTTLWNVPLSRTANQPPLDHVSLAKVTTGTAGAVLWLSVRTTFDDVKVTILDSPGDLSMKKRRVIEHVLKDVDTNAVLARGALKAPGEGQP